MIDLNDSLPVHPLRHAQRGTRLSRSLSHRGGGSQNEINSHSLMLVPEAAMGGHHQVESAGLFDTMPAEAP
eukprot:3461848-Prorocentrum_lima.AAC.1